MYDVIVIGAGASGLMAAVSAAESGASVLILEKNEKIGKKLFITGKGRCNVTNACERDSFFNCILRNPKFLLSSFSSFDNSDLMAKIESTGVKLKVERGNRVFPVSDKSSDIIKAFSILLRKNNVPVKFNTCIKNIQKSGDVFYVSSDADDFQSKSVIIATGGLSYPSTGSTGDGYAFAQKFNHRIKTTAPALVPLLSEEFFCPELKGVSLKNVRIDMVQNNKTVYSELGEMLFTHNGISGPLVLSASSRINPDDFSSVVCKIDLKPGLDFDMLDNRILRDFGKYTNKQIDNALHDLLISKLIDPVLKKACIPYDKVVNSISREERLRLESVIKSFSVNISGYASYSEAVITRGGVDVREINPKSMESKLVDRLFFCGEILDLDAETGGYNLQIAFSTGYAAGKHAL